MARDQKPVIPDAAEVRVTATPKVWFEVTERDWPEDFSHENGQYMNTCVYCKLVFTGYKRRVVCKACHSNESKPD